MDILNTMADIGFVAPLQAAALLMLLARRERETAFRWGAAFALAAAATGLLKSLLRGSADLPYFPSGHVSVAVTFYGGLLFALMAGRAGFVSRLVLLAAIALPVGWSRVETTDHSWTDVFGGFAVGGLALLLLGCMRPARPVAAATRLWVLVAVLLASPVGLAMYSWVGHSWRTMLE
jgi:membrane-associated phospholipid phosphatase